MFHWKGHHAGEGGRQLRTECDLGPAAVHEHEGLLLHQFLAGLGGVQVQFLQKRTVIFLIGKRLGDRAHLSVEPGAECHVLRVKFTGTFHALNDFFHVLSK